MTFNDFKKLLLANKDKCGVTCWCANCGCNLMHAPVKYTLKTMRESYDFCFSQCRSCGMKNPPLKQAQVFTTWEFNNCPTYRESYYKNRKVEDKPRKKWYDQI